MTLLDFFLIGLGAFAAGAVNALAGGGTLITFPVLTALGIPPVVANLTNTVALCPGYFGAALAQKKELQDQKMRLGLLLPAGVAGGVAGALLLLNSDERMFTNLIPWLILLGVIFLAAGEPIKKWFSTRASGIRRIKESAAILPVGLAAVYGGYFGAGLSVIVLAVLGISYNDSLTKLNALKQAIALAVNISAAVVFLFSGEVMWSAAIVMMICALAGGSAGGRLAGRIHPNLLRWIVIGIGLVVAIFYFLKNM